MLNGNKVGATVKRTFDPQKDYWLAIPRILPKFLTESKTATAQLRACLDIRSQFPSTSFAAASAWLIPLTNRNPLSVGKYLSAPVFSVMTGRPSARKVAA